MSDVWRVWKYVVRAARTGRMWSGSASDIDGSQRNSAASGVGYWKLNRA